MTFTIVGIVGKFFPLLIASCSTRILTRTNKSITQIWNLVRNCRLARLFLVGLRWGTGMVTLIFNVTRLRMCQVFGLERDAQIRTEFSPNCMQ